MKYIFKILTLFLLVVTASCKKTVQPAPLFSLLQSEKTNIHFSNDLPINLDLNIFNYMYYYNGGGVAVGDLNKDGKTDIVFSSNLNKEKIYINEGNLNFKEINTIVDGGPNSWTNGVTLADINNDGFLDIYLSQVGKFRSLDCTNKLFVFIKLDKNNHPVYEEKSAEYGLDFQGLSTQAGFFDYDLDGDLDMFLMNHSLHHNGTFGLRTDFLNTYHETSGDRLYRNDGAKFTEVTKECGIHSSAIGYGLGLAFGDVNNDGWPDIYVGNDFHENDYLYINQGDGTFKDELPDQVKHTSRFSMGVDIADVNNDGFQDIISLDMLPEDPYILKTSEGEDALDIFNFKLGYGYNHQYARNTLQLNQGNGSFKEIGALANIHATDWSWSPLFFDMDMDGQKDLFISNGIPKRMNDIDYINFISGNDIQYKIQFDHLEKQDLTALEKIPEIKLYNKFYKGNSSLEFEDLKNQIAGHEVSYSNSAAFADFDNDGDYDVVTNNINQKAFIYENNSNKKSVRIILNGSEQNPFAVGSQIVTTSKDKTAWYSFSPTKGFQSCMYHEILIPKENLQAVKLIWPDNTFEEIKYNSEDSLIFTYKKDWPKHNSEILKPTFELEDITEKTNVNFIHKENPFVEFNREPLIPFSTSAEGPALAVGDVNGDGLEDFFIGSSKRKQHKLYIQNNNGTFETQPLIGSPKDSIYEEVDAIFADVDGDKDQDLLIATGGNEYKLSSPYTRPLLYRNENGQLKREETAFEKINITASCIKLNDIDQDGDLDIFLGGRAVPRSYGAIPKSYILENDGMGNFSDATEKWCPELSEIGFVRDAEWADINGDKYLDLVLALEWSPIKILFNNKEKLHITNIDENSGWWNSITTGDFDGDGDMDIFAGNLGKNARVKASTSHPVRLYYEDFDDNSVPEQILTYYIGNRELPFSNMLEMQKQIPKLKKQFLYAKDFARASVSELLGKEKTSKAEVFQATHLENTLYINNGGGNFSKGELPLDMQFTSYNTALAIDLNNDGKTDIFPGGNYYYCNVQMGRYDSENGSVLINSGDAKFDYFNIKNNLLKGQVRKIKPINTFHMSPS